MGLLSTLGSIGGMFIPGLGPAGAALGGTLGGLLEGNQQTNGGAGATSASQTRDPWAAAQPYMRQGLADTAAMQKFYQKTPFNPLQIQQYSNQFNDLGNFRENVMPGLLGFANSGMSQGYQRGGSTLAPSQRGEQKPTFSMRPTQGLLDLNGPQFNPGAQIAQRNEVQAAVPQSYTEGQSTDPVWEKVLSDFNAEHMARYGIPMNRDWNADEDARNAYKTLTNRYLEMKG